MFTAVWKRVPQLLLVAAVLVAAPAATQTISKFPVTNLSIRTPWTGSGPMDDWDGGLGIDIHAGVLVHPRFSLGLGANRNWYETETGYRATTNSVFLHWQTFFMDSKKERLERFFGVRLGYIGMRGDSLLVDKMQHGLTLAITMSSQYLPLFKGRVTPDAMMFMATEWYMGDRLFFGVGWMLGLGTQPI